MKGEQLPLSVQLRGTAGFESFHAGSNQPVVELLRRFAEGADDTAGVLLYGPTAAGKTHLLQAAARAAQQRGARVAYLPLAQVGAEPEALDGLHHCALVCLDDVDASVRPRESDLRLLRLLDRLRAERHRWLAAASAPPERLQGLLPDLRTRLSAAVVLGLKPLSDAGRLQLLQRGAQMRGLELPEEVARWLLSQLPRDPASLVAALDRLDTASLRAKRRLTLPFVQQALAGPPADAS